MSQMNSIFGRLRSLVLYGTSSKLRGYEEAVLDAWRTRLSRDGESLLSAQLKHLVSYQRQAGGKLLAFFTLGKQPYPALPHELLFPCKLESCVVARIYLTNADGTGTRSQLRGEVQLHKGRLIFIEFNRAPGKELSRCVWVTKVEILRDPMIPASEESISEAERRNRVSTTIQSKLPDEYLQVVAEGAGVLINEWAVFAVSDIRKIPQRDGSYYLLAEKEHMGAIGVREDEFSGELYYLDYGDDRGEKITVGFRKFLEEFDGGKINGRF